MTAPPSPKDAHATGYRPYPQPNATSRSASTPHHGSPPSKATSGDVSEAPPNNHRTGGHFGGFLPLCDKHEAEMRRSDGLQACHASWFQARASADQQLERARSNAAKEKSAFSRQLLEQSRRSALAESSIEHEALKGYMRYGEARAERWSKHRHSESARFRQAYLDNEAEESERQRQLISGRDRQVERLRQSGFRMTGGLQAMAAQPGSPGSPRSSWPAPHTARAAYYRHGASGHARHTRGDSGWRPVPPSPKRAAAVDDD